jgi:hypothetical protein
MMNVWELRKVEEPELMKRLGKIIPNIEREYPCSSRVVGKRLKNLVAKRFTSRCYRISFSLKGYLEAAVKNTNYELLKNRKKWYDYFSKVKRGLP